MKILHNLRTIVPGAVILAMITPVFMSSCSDDEKTVYEEYAQWREDNENWLNEQIARTNPDGTPFYTKYTPSYSPGGTIYYRFINDPAENAGNLRPYYTSSATVNYAVYLYDGTRVDSAANYTSALNSSGLISGWSTAITQMHVGDSIEAILPYEVAYGVSGYSGIKPFSTLRFNIRLTDVPNYVTRP